MTKLPFRVILNEVKNLKSVTLCIQILRVAQDDTMERHHHQFRMTIWGLIILETECFLYLIHIVELFPSEEFHFDCLGFAIHRFVSLGNHLWFASHVTV